MKLRIFLGIALVIVMGTGGAMAVPPQYRVASHSYDHYCALATAAIAQVELTDAGLYDQNRDDPKRTEIERLAKQPLFKNIWEVVYRLVLHQTDGKSLTAIVVTTSYYGECPGDHVKAYVISRAVGKLPSLKYLPEPTDSKRP